MLAVVTIGQNDTVVMIFAAMVFGLGLFVWMVSTVIGILRRFLDGE